MKYFFLIVFLCCTQFIFSQSVNKISGIVTNEKNKPLSFVTVELIRANDSTLIKSTITDESGNFDFTDISSDQLLIKLTSVGFLTHYVSVINFEKLKIILKESEVTLTNHIVNVKKPFIEVKTDKVVLNVESSINSSGINAFELLRKSPGVQIDNNDNISMKGKSGVRVAIDGRLTQFDAKDLSAYLKSINSSEIELVELISNPSAKYDASGNAGIINIKLKKSKRYGTNGSVNLNFIEGITPKGNGNLNLNFRNPKFNVFGNVGLTSGINQNSLNLYRLQKDTLYDFKNINKQRENNLNIRAGVDYVMDSKNTIGFLLISGNTNNEELGFSNTPIYLNSTHQFIKNLQSNGDRIVRFNNSNMNINYSFVDSAGIDINVDANYGRYRKTGKSYQPNLYLDQNNSLLYSVINRNETPVDIDIYNLKLDYEKKIKKGKLGLGFKINQVCTNNTFNFYTEDVNGISIKDLSKSNLFDYRENVNAAYFNLNKELNKKWNFQLGLRFEHTQSKGILNRLDTVIQTDNNVSKTYLDFFPSFALNLKQDENNTFNFSYSRRIDRPTYQDLNPFENKLDELTYQKGNAFLKPQYTNSFQIIYNYKSIINLSTGYTKVSDYSTEVTDTIRNATYIQQQNLASERIMNIELGIQTPIKKWWNGYVNLWFIEKMFDGAIGNNSLSQKIPTYGANMQQTFNLGKDYDAEINAWYEGPSVWGGTWRTSTQGAIDIGFQKKLFKKSATIKIGVTDLFFTAPWKAYTKFGGVDIRGNGDWESRTLKLSFSWRLGNNQIVANRKRETGIESETKRIK